MRSIPIHVLPRDNSILSHQRLAEQFQHVLDHNCESRSNPLARGWSAVFGMWLEDFITQDNGAFMIVEGPGRPDGPLTGAPTKLVHLDSGSCTRTGDYEFPVIYRENGTPYKLHRSRVLAASSLPSPQLGMHGIGFCGVSRMVNNGQILYDQDVFLQEQMGSRPARQMILIKKGATVRDIARAFMTAEVAMDNQGLTRYSKTVVVGPNDRSGASEIDLDKIDLSTVPPGHDRSDTQAKGMFVIALALGVPARWLWPATTTGATKADALYQHVVGLVTGPAEVLMTITHGLETLFLPPTLMISTDYQDDEQDRAAAEIRNVRSQARERDLKAQVITIRVAREQMLAAGELTEAQFIQMELEQGRLRDGSDVLAAFSLPDPEMQRMLDLGIEEPLAVDAHDPIEVLLSIEAAAIAATDIAASGRTPSLRLKAKQAIAALGKLKRMYEQRASAQAQREMGISQGTAGAPVAGTQTPAQAQAQGQAQGVQQPAAQPAQGGPPSEGAGAQGPAAKSFGRRLLDITDWLTTRLGRKAFDFGVGGGELIGGGLARDPQGEFIAAEDLQASVQAELMNRLAAARLSDEERAANRARIAASLGIDPSDLDALGTDDPGALDAAQQSRMVDAGLLYRDERTGKVSRTFKGTTLLNAANRGDSATANAVIREEEKPGKGGGGAATKPSREEEEQANRKKVADNLSGEMEKGDLEALHSFQQGGPLDPERAQRMAQDGLIEYDQDGDPRLARAGSSLLKAANAGEAGEARDLLSRSREEVQAKVEAAAEFRDEITRMEQMLSRVEGSGQIKDKIQASRLRAQIRKATRRADQVERSLGILEEKIEEAESEAEEQE